MEMLMWKLLSLGVLLLFQSQKGNALMCHSCQGGVLTNCAAVRGLGADEDCPGENAQCYEALVAYQNGALTLIQRRCWQPPDSSNATDFCQSFDNPNGKLGRCITCKTDLCNTDLDFWKY